MKLTRNVDGSEVREGAPAELAEYERLRQPPVSVPTAWTLGSSEVMSGCLHSLGFSSSTRCDHPITCACKGWGCGTVSIATEMPSPQDVLTSGVKVY